METDTNSEQKELILILIRESLRARRVGRLKQKKSECCYRVFEESMRNWIWGKAVVLWAP